MDLIISNEQIRRALRYLRESGGCRGDSCADTSVSPQQLSKIKAYLQHLPEIREACVERLRGQLPTYRVDSMAVAEKMVGRLLADMLR